MKYSLPLILLVLSLLANQTGALGATTSQPTYDLTTLAGKMASIDNTNGLYLQTSSLIQQEADMSDQTTNPTPNNPITPTFVLSSPLDGNTVKPPDVTVNRDTAAASQNEPIIAVDPNNPNRVVAAANDYVTRSWTCFVGSTPCSALGDGYSGTYFSNDSGNTWCCAATDPSNIGTLIPGVEHLVGGQYDAGGDPSLAFNSQGVVYYAGLGFDRTSPPNTVAVNRGMFDGSGNLHWGPPTFINPTTSASMLSDKEWIASDFHATSPFRDRVYVTWTRFIFNPTNGAYVQSPIDFVYSTDGGATFSTPQLIVGNVIYDQGSRVVVGSDGTVYVFWEGSTRLATFNSIWMTKSTDGGITFSKPVAIALLVDTLRPFNTVFRVNSFPAAAIAPDGTLYAAWTSEVNNGASTYTADQACAFFLTPASSVYNNCHSSGVYSKSTDGGSTWSTPLPIFPALDTGTRMAIGYPATANGDTLNAPAPHRIDMIFPGVAASASGRVYMSAYASDVVSPWQLCANPASPTPVGRINCLTLDNYVNNGRLDYFVADLTTGVSHKVTTNPVNTRYHFGGGFIGDYTAVAAGSDNVFHAVWMDANNKQTVVWWYGFQFAPTIVHQQDIATASGNF